MLVENEYERKGAVHLFAAFDTRTGKVYHCTGEHKRQIEFIQLLEILDREFDAAVTAIHIVLDNLRMHKGKLVKAWLGKHTRFQFHHPPVHLLLDESGGAVVQHSAAQTAGHYQFRGQESLDPTHRRVRLRVE